MPIIREAKRKPYLEINQEFSPWDGSHLSHSGTQTEPLCHIFLWNYICKSYNAYINEIYL